MLFWIRQQIHHNDDNHSGDNNDGDATHNIFLARGQGLEPRSTASKAAVLPLDDPRIRRPVYHGVYAKSRPGSIKYLAKGVVI